MSKFYLRLKAGILAVALSGASAAVADEMVTSESSHSSSTEVVDGVKKVNYKFKERLNNLADQIQLGIKKGWLSAEQAEAFTKEHARVDAEEGAVKAKNYVKAEVDQLEKDVTALNEKLSTALTKGSQPKTEASGQTKTESKTETKSAAKQTKTTAKAKPAKKSQ
jgi:hypothetical protein